MSTIWLVARKECLEMSRDGRLRAGAVLVFLLLLAAISMGWKQQHTIRRERDEAARHARSVWVGQSPKDPHNAAHFGTYAFKPRLPLALVDHGLDPYVGVAVYLEAHHMNNARYLPAQDRTSLERFGQLTAAVVLQVLLPLLIALVTFGAIAGEREEGSLRQLLSLGVSARGLVAGKGIGLAAMLALLLAPAATLGAVALAFSDSGAPFIGSRVAALTATYLVYFTAWAALCLLVSARARSSRTALVVLLAAWGWNSLIAPRLFSDVARAVYPAPSAAEFAEAVQRDILNGVDGHNPADRRRKELETKLLQQYGAKTLAELPVNFQGLALQMGEESSNEVWDKHYSALWGRYEQQGALMSWMGVAAPLMAARALSMSLSGTDFTHHRDFAWSAERYRRTMVKALNNDLAYHSRYRQQYKAGRALWESIPDFRYELPSTGWALSQQRPALIVLGVWCVGAVAAVVAGVRRLEVA